MILLSERLQKANRLVRHEAVKLIALLHLRCPPNRYRALPVV